MNILGWGRKKPAAHEADNTPSAPAAPVQDILYALPGQVKVTDFEITEIAGQRIITIKQAYNPVQGIIFPAVQPTDMWKASALVKLVTKIEAMYEAGWLDICVINDAVRNFSLKGTPSSLQALEDLHRIHCVKFNALPPSVFEAIPRYLTHIFTEGRIPLEAVVIESICETVDIPEGVSP